MKIEFTGNVHEKGSETIESTSEIDWQWKKMLTIIKMNINAKTHTNTINSPSSYGMTLKLMILIVLGCWDVSELLVDATERMPEFISCVCTVFTVEQQFVANKWFSCSYSMWLSFMMKLIYHSK